MHNLAAHTYPHLLSSTGLIASSTDFYTECVDMRGYEGVQFHIVIDSASSANAVAYAQMSATSSGTGTFVDVYGSTVGSTGFAAASALMVIDVFRPKYRWVRCYVDRSSTEEAILAITALQYRPQVSAPGFSTARGVADVNIVVGTSS